MNKEHIMDAIGGLEDGLITETGAARDRAKKRKRIWATIGAAAASLAVVVGLFALNGRSKPHPVLQWDAHFAAEDYFKYSGANQTYSAENSLTRLPYAESRMFTDMREELEAEGVIPVIEADYFLCQANYNEDGSLYSLEISWNRRGYTLRVTAGPEEVPEITDCVAIELDAEGNVVEPTITVTERDGIPIIGEKPFPQTNRLTFQSDTGWYQITAPGSFTAADAAGLLDWLWEHPIDFDRFPMEAGDNYESLYENGELPNIPEVFTAHIPDFAALGYETEAQWLGLKNGEVYRFEGSYRSDTVPSLSWSVEGEPENADRERVAGDFADLTYDMVAKARAEGQNIYFTWDGYVIAMYVSDLATAEDMWTVIVSLR